MKTVDNTVEYDNIHLYFHLRYVNSPADSANKEYHSLVSPIVLNGGRPNAAQNPTMKPPSTMMEKIENAIESFLPFGKKAITADIIDNRTAGAANHINVSQTIIALFFFNNRASRPIQEQQQRSCKKHKYTCCHSIFPWFLYNLQYAVSPMSILSITVSCNVDILT